VERVEVEYIVVEHVECFRDWSFVVLLSILRENLDIRRRLTLVLSDSPFHAKERWQFHKPVK
jgi:hypothetical protein